MVFGALGSFWLQRPQAEMDLQEVTLERVTKNNAKFVMILLRTIYHETKKIEALGKKTWRKAIVRLVDKKGQGLYAEIRGSTEKDVLGRAKEFFQPIGFCK